MTSPFREQVLELIVLGRHDREIAETLSLAVSTVGHHVTALIREHGARDRDDVARLILTNRIAAERARRVLVEQDLELCRARLAAREAEVVMLERQARAREETVDRLGPVCGG